MKITPIILLLLLLCPLIAFSQGNLNSLDFTEKLGSKNIVTLKDAVSFFMFALDKKPGKFEKDISELQKLGILKKNKKKYQGKNHLRMGFLCNIIVPYLKLDDSMMYRIFKTDRYAHRTCVASGIVREGTSEWNKLSGEELIEIMSIVIERSGAEK